MILLHIYKLYFTSKECNAFNKYVLYMQDMLQSKANSDRIGSEEHPIHLKL